MSDPKWVIPPERRLLRRAPDHLLSVCWCEARTVEVPRVDIHAGLTRSCGLEGCAPR